MSGHNSVLIDGNLKLQQDGAVSIMTVKDFASPVAQDGVNSPIKKPNTPNTPDQESAEDYTITEWAKWGDNDDLPEQIITYLDKLGVAKSAIDTNTNAHYGSGILWVKDKYTEDGKVVKVPQNLSWWRKWLRETGYEITHTELIESLETFYIAFPEVILDDKNKVVSVKILDTPYCRLGKRNAKGQITRVFYPCSAKFADKPTLIPVFDPQAPFKYKKFVYPLMYRSFGKPYHPEPNYYATFRAGWADVAIQVAQFMKSVYTNMMTLKYHVIVPISTMKTKYKDWDTKDEQEQIKLVLEFKANVDEHLTKSENAGKSIISVFDDETQRETVKIEPIKNFLDSTRELPSNVAANSEILFAIGTDPALVGLNNPGGGKDLNGSGGSDKRESRKIKQANQKADRTVSLQILNLIGWMNGVPDDVYPVYMDADTSQTMDENPTGSQNIVA